ncbi:hypothetical protein ASPCAL14454 [Aspergillus calidoustus]|jgi:hypothetical protein|uniref:SnoaL-like domain-containing protein n=1 Tax=Aspergillus calidoustus TaxID=454130 RepID=A0A0U5GJ21_ASPCI|nr:hypothetical protein ASPCAL14454 [Aspergillus calidoustus]
MTLLKQDLTNITTAAEKHILAYSVDITSPNFPTSTERAAKLSTYYLPSISFFAGGAPIQLSDPSLFVQLISGPLDRIQGLALDVIGHRVEAVAENSAIIWLTLRVDDKVEVSNVYFFRKGEDGKAGFEGGVFDGEVWLLKQLGLA